MIPASHLAGAGVASQAAALGAMQSPPLSTAASVAVATTPPALTHSMMSVASSMTSPHLVAAGAQYAGITDK